MNTEIILCSYVCGKAALQEATQYRMFLKGETSSVLTGYFFYLWTDFKFGFSLLHLDLTYTKLHHPKHIHRMSISGIYNCRITNRNIQNYRNTQPGGIPCTDASIHTNTHTQNHTCTFSLCMQCHTYKAQRSGNII